MLANRRNSLSDQAKSESKLLKTYGITVPTVETNHCHSQADNEAVKILNMFSPVMNSAYIPLKTIGDGNCLFRAVSLALSGSDEYHCLLRLMTALEMINNRNSYDTKKPHNDFLNDIRILTSDYNKLVADAIVENSFCEMAHVYALSAAIGESISSYFPPQLQTELSSAFTRIVHGRGISVLKPKVMIMWSSMIAPTSVKSFHSNHFVPLVTRECEATASDIIDISDLNHDVTNENNELSANNFPLYPGESFSDMYGCDSSDLVTLSDISVRDLVDGNSSDSTGHEATENPPEASSSVDSNPGSETVDDKETPVGVSDIAGECAGHEATDDPSEASNPTDSNPTPTDVSISPNVSKPVESDMHGVLESGFLDTSTVITHLLKKVPGLPNIPSGSKENVYFIIDNRSNIDNRSSKKRSAFSDDRGIWKSSSGTSPKTYYLLHDNGDLSTVCLRNGLFCVRKMVNKHTEYRPLSPQPPNEQVVVVHRYYTTLKHELTSKQDKGYRKKVTWLGEGGLESSLAFVEYVGKFPGHAPHGLSQDQTHEYIRRPGYVIDDIERLNGQKRKPADIYLTMKETYDETTRPEMKTIYNKIGYLKRQTAENNGQILTTNVADQICHLENMVSDNDNFVRSMIRTGGKTPTIILYTDEQIADIKTLCCSGRTVLGVDKTFNLCRMHVTVTCYKQLTVTVDKTDEPPLFLGPLFVHDNSDYETYSYFFHHLRLKLGPNLAKLVIGSDEEQAMVKSIMTEFPNSSHVLCTRHLKENCRQHLIDDGVPEPDRLVIMQKIFGTDGLANATDDTCFDSICDDVDALCSNFSSKFAQYFRKRLAPNIKTKVNDPLREGIISTNWTNNNSESINHVLKQTVNWESKNLPEFVRLVRRVVAGQFQELRSALLSSGKYRLAVSHRHFEVSKSTWIDMTEQQRTNLYRRYRQYVTSDNRTVTSTDGRSTVVAPKTGGKKPGQRKRKVNVRTVTVDFKRTKTNGQV